jgi:NADP-dependent 3-hydroxy acid dehydrogenase YdfG
MTTDRDGGRVAVITGASSGIGAATARALAGDGHRLALLARRRDRVEALADELGDGALAIEADVTDRESIVAAAERVRAELGGADVLVNNAGVMLLPEVRVTLIEPGAVATELTDHITDPNAKDAAEKMYDELAITAGDIAEVIAFAVSRPRHVSLNEILIRPTAQEF